MMKIEIWHVVGADRKRIKCALKAEFPDPPAVVILETRLEKTKEVIPFTVTNGPTKKADQESVAGKIDAVLMRHGYKLCHPAYRQVTIHKPERVAPAWNIND